MSSCNCCFLTCIQVSQEAGQVLWYAHLFQNFPQFIVIHTVEGFGVVNKAEIDVFLELSCFFDDPADIGNLISGSSAFSKTSLNIWSNTWSKGKFGLGVHNEAGKRLIEFCQENTLANTLFQQHKRRLYTWTSPDGQHQNQTDYIPCSQRWRSSIQSAKTRPGADCGSDHELLIAKFRLKLNKVGKTTIPLRYDLIQIPYDYTLEVRNRFKGLSDRQTA